MTAESASIDSPGPSIRYACALLVASCLIAYIPFVVAEPFWDDRAIIRPDGPIASLASIPLVFQVRSPLFPPGSGLSYYRPVVDTLFIVEYAIGGTSSLLYHTTNLMIHVFNVLLFFGLCLGLQGRERRIETALLGAGLFALHPVQAESVLWIAGRYATLAMSFLLLAGHAALRSVLAADAGKRLAWAAATGAALLASLLCKEFAFAALPALVPLAIFAFRQSSDRLTHAIPTGVAVVIATAICVALNGDSSTAGLGGTLRTLGLARLLLSLTSVFGFYLECLLWPFRLAPLYPIGVDQSPVYLVLGGIGAVVSLGFVGWLCTRKILAAALAASAILFFGASALLPVLAGQFQLADRYLYQSLAGLGLLAALFLPRPRRLALGVIAPLVLLTALCLRQSSFWVEENVLWTRVLEVDPNSEDGNFQLAEHFVRTGHPERALPLWRAGIESPNRSNRPRVRIARASQMAWTAFTLGENEQAIWAANVAAADPEFSQESSALMAFLLFESGRPEEARTALSRITDSDSLSSRGTIVLALTELRHLGLPGAARARYARLRANGGPVVPELEADPEIPGEQD
ncbi:tetratricopeptide repeat protein [bacterium]|nr:tetratricopeptide repeat protein [bacterium]